MDNDGQLTFSDDPLLNESNKAYQQIEEGNFDEAVRRIDDLMSKDPYYPGLSEGYRTARFWLNRTGELMSLPDGKETADFLMKQWEIYDTYAAEKGMKESTAYRAAMRHVFYKASEHYQKAFRNLEDPTGNFDLLLNLGNCFLRLEEYRLTIDTLEYARSSYTASPHLLIILAEAYYHSDDIPRSLLLFREAFFVDPSEIDLEIIRSRPIHDIIDMIDEWNSRSATPFRQDTREWIPVFGFIQDIFYVRKNLSKHQIDTIEREIYNLEIYYKRMNRDQIYSTPVLPRLMNKYLWMYEYYEIQNYNFENMIQIRDRLLVLNRELFNEFFRKKST